MSGATRDRWKSFPGSLQWFPPFAIWVLRAACLAPHLRFAQTPNNLRERFVSQSVLSSCAPYLCFFARDDGTATVCGVLTAAFAARSSSLAHQLSTSRFASTRSPRS